MNTETNAWDFTSQLSHAEDARQDLINNKKDLEHGAALDFDAQDKIGKKLVLFISKYPQLKNDIFSCVQLLVQKSKDSNFFSMFPREILKSLEDPNTSTTATQLYLFYIDCLRTKFKTAAQLCEHSIEFMFIQLLHHINPTHVPILPNIVQVIESLWNNFKLQIKHMSMGTYKKFKLIASSDPTTDGMKWKWVNFGILLGKGSYGHVWKGASLRTGEPVALKVIDNYAFEHNPEVKRLLDNEVRVMREMSKETNTAILRILDQMTMPKSKNMMIVLEFCSGGDLESYLKKKPGKKVSEAEAIVILKEIARGLKGLRQKKIVHRDLKPDNLLFNEQGQMKIADFGFARLMQADEMAKTHAGSPLYMDPEGLHHYLNPQAGGGYSEKADLWSVGCIICRMLTGSAPFPAGDIYTLLRMVSSGGFRWPREILVSDQMKDLVSRLLQRDSKNRIEWDDFFKHPLVQDEREEMERKRKQEEELRSKKERKEKMKEEREKEYEEMRKQIEELKQRNRGSEDLADKYAKLFAREQDLRVRAGEEKEQYKKLLNVANAKIEKLEKEAEESRTLRAKLEQLDQSENLVNTRLLNLTVKLAQVGQKLEQFQGKRNITLNN